MAATLASGTLSALSHLSAANLFGISDRKPDRIQIPVTTPLRTLVDLATVLDCKQLESATIASEHSSSCWLP